MTWQLRDGMTWQERAACRGMDPRIFTPDENEGEDHKRVVDAKRVCGGCGVAGECLAYALETQQPTGVWGNLTAIERNRILAASGRKRRR